MTPKPSAPTLRPWRPCGASCGRSKNFPVAVAAVIASVAYRNYHTRPRPANRF